MSALVIYENRPLRKLLPAAILAAATLAYGGQADEEVSTVSLVTASETVPRGGTFEVGVRIRLQPGWHTYGDPPGDSGMPPQVLWHLPKGWRVHPLDLPPAKTFRDVVGVSRGYEKEVTLPFHLTVPAALPPADDVVLRCRVEYLVCRDVCLPQEADLTLSLRVTTTAPGPSSERTAPPTSTSTKGEPHP